MVVWWILIGSNPVWSYLCGFWVCLPCLCGGHRLTGDSKLTVRVCLSVSVRALSQSEILR